MAKAREKRPGHKEFLANRPPEAAKPCVRVHGDSPRNKPVYVSAKPDHAQVAAGKPVVYAGTARFDQGSMDWWSNYSGTYQPIAEFRGQASLPEDKFVPWQKLQMGGYAMQRGLLNDRRAAAVPQAPEPAPVNDDSSVFKDYAFLVSGPSHGGVQARAG